MRLLDITATAHPGGNRIDLAWRNPSPEDVPGIRVVRREDTHPTGVDDGVVVAHTTGASTLPDEDLMGERVYYYALFPFTGDPPRYRPDPHNVASATALSRYGFAGRLYDLLPAIYRRYDRREQLRAFLELPGAELDRLYSLIRATPALTDLNRVDGRLLPLLAQWIGWPTDHSLAVGAQRNEILAAPRLYQAVGTVPALDATVARVTRCASRTKEFVHNVARANHPERLNLWAVERDSDGRWGDAELVSLNFAYDGRPAAARLPDGSQLFFFHTRRTHGWDIWAKSFTGSAWQPSTPVVDRPGIDINPAAATHGDQLWLFWQSYDPGQPPAERRWRLWFATRTGHTWSTPAPFGTEDTARRLPAVTADDAGGLWLFWLERSAGGWHLRYNRHDGTDWQLSTPATLPVLSGQQPRVEDDLYVLFHPTSATGRLWLFWARHDPDGPDEARRWSIAYQFKEGLDPAASDWSPVGTLPKAGGRGYHDRQPVALPAGDGDIDVFWASTKYGGWSVVGNRLTTDPPTWGTEQRIPATAHTQRAPLAVVSDAGTLVVYRSNQSIARTSDVYGATQTLDHRYAGSTTVDTAAVDKVALRGEFDDFLTYTHHTGSGRIARNTVGIYLTPGTDDSPEDIDAARSRLAGVLPDFVPATVRAVLITPPPP